MVYLLLVIAFVILLGIVFPKIHEINSKARILYCVAVFALLFGFAALRGVTCGIDTAHRYNDFNRIAPLDFGELIENYSKYHESRYTDWHQEIGYQVLVFALTRLFTEPFMAEIVYAAFIISIHLWFLQKYAKELPLSIGLFIVFNFSASMNTTRQYIAIALILVMIDAVINQKFFKSITFLLLAVLFHASSVLCLPLIVFCFTKVRANKKMFSIMIIICAAIILLWSPLLSLVFKILPQYERYLDFTSSGGDSPISAPWILLYLAVISLSFLRFKKEKPYQNKQFKVMVRSNNLIPILFLAFATLDILSSFLTAFYRVMRFFYIGFIILIPETPRLLIKDRDNVSRAVYYLAFMTFLLVIGYIEFSANKYAIFPYVFFWEA